MRGPRLAAAADDGRAHPNPDHCDIRVQGGGHLGAGGQGGDGLVREIEFLAPMAGGILSERRVRAAFGLAGGSPGAVGRNVLIRGGVETELPGRAAFDARIGDVLRIETPGGGGVGA